MKTYRLLCVVLLVSAVRGDATAVEPKANNELTHPERVSIPDDIPFTTVVTGMLNKEDREPRSKRLFPTIDYQMGHYDGWQIALTTIRDNGVAIAKKPNPIRFVVSTNSPTLIRGMEAGYRACLEACDNRLKRGESEVRLRRQCAAAYAPTSIAPKPTSQSGSPPLPPLFAPDY